MWVSLRSLSGADGLCLCHLPFTFSQKGWIRIMSNAYVFGVDSLVAKRKTLMFTGKSWVVMTFDLFRKEGSKGSQGDACTQTIWMGT